MTYAYDIKGELPLEEVLAMPLGEQMKYIEWFDEQFVAFMDNGLKAMHELGEELNTPATPEQEAEFRKLGEEYRRTNAPTVCLIEDAVTEVFNKRMAKAQGIVAARA
ncbi:MULTISPECIES: hypothetical protein [unclassified Pannonibacter]|uniref:hypothetical protein n=1 Tax=unclassified Pannonibacter TaxID=2627228 RepID=UPI001648E3DF|nr:MULTISPECIES: hypothetical protein [unclassified Pannonibacter]